MKKQETEPLFNVCCAYCEHGKWDEEENRVFCKKKNKETKPDSACRLFSYDLLKRKPQILRFSELEFPII